MKLANEILEMLNEKVVVIIKPTKHNKEVIKKHGLASDSGNKYFNLFSTILDDNEEFKLDPNDKYDAMIVKELDSIGVKY